MGGDSVESNCNKFLKRTTHTGFYKASHLGDFWNRFPNEATFKWRPEVGVVANKGEGSDGPVKKEKPDVLQELVTGISLAHLRCADKLKGGIEYLCLYTYLPSLFCCCFHSPSRTFLGLSPQGRIHYFYCNES